MLQDCHQTSVGMKSLDIIRKLLKLPGWVLHRLIKNWVIRLFYFCVGVRVHGQLTTKILTFSMKIIFQAKKKMTC